MYFLFKWPHSNTVHVTTNELLYAEQYCITVIEEKENVTAFCELRKNDVCWCDEKSIPHLI